MSKILTDLLSTPLLRAFGRRRRESDHGPGAPLRKVNYKPVELQQLSMLPRLQCAVQSTQMGVALPAIAGDRLRIEHVFARGCSGGGLGAVRDGKGGSIASLDPEGVALATSTLLPRR